MRERVDIRPDMIRFLMRLAPLLAAFSAGLTVWSIVHGATADAWAGAFGVVFWVGIILYRDRILGWLEAETHDES